MLYKRNYHILHILYVLFILTSISRHVCPLLFYICYTIFSNFLYINYCPHIKGYVQSIISFFFFFYQNLIFSNLFWQKNITGIKADGGSYSLSSIKDAIKSGIGSTPWIQCNEDESGNRQLYQIYICVDNSGSNIIECPVMPTGKCSSNIEFPSF